MKSIIFISIFVFGLGFYTVFAGEKVAKEDQTEDQNRSRKDKAEIHSKRIKELKILASNALDKNNKDAIEYYTKAAKLGDSASQCFLGSCYFYGMHGIEKDIDKAVHWYRMAARQGNKIAQDQLARCFATGDVNSRGKKTSAQKSAKWSEKSHKPE